MGRIRGARCPCVPRILSLPSLMAPFNRHLLSTYCVLSLRQDLGYSRDGFLLSGACTCISEQETENKQQTDSRMGWFHSLAVLGRLGTRGQRQRQRGGQRVLLPVVREASLGRRPLSQSQEDKRRTATQRHWPPLRG